MSLEIGVEGEGKGNTSQELVKKQDEWVSYYIEVRNITYVNGNSTAKCLR